MLSVMRHAPAHAKSEIAACLELVTAWLRAAAAVVAEAAGVQQEGDRRQQAITDTSKPQDAAVSQIQVKVCILHLLLLWRHCTNRLVCCAACHSSGRQATGVT